MLRDLLYAVRGLRRSPGFVAVGVVCLGLGLGIATTVFAMLDAVVKPHLPYRDPDGLFEVAMWGDGASGEVRSRDLLDALRGRSGLFAGVSSTDWQFEPGPLAVGDRMVNGHAAIVDRHFFEVLGIRPLQGRAFQPGDEGRDVAMVTAGLWDGAFAGTPLGEARITVGERTYQVIGVLPRGLRHPTDDGVFRYEPEVRGSSEGLSEWLKPYVRLRPGADTAAVQRELTALAGLMETEHGAGRMRFRFQLRSVRADPFELREIHGSLAAGAVAVLLIACANLANLLLARGLARRRDLVVHVAVGATRGALVRQLLSEAAIVSLAGGAVGIGVTVWGSMVLRGAIPRSWAGGLQSLLEPQMSWRVFAFGFAAALVSALVFGLGPALRASDLRAAEVLKDAAGTTTGRSRHAYNGIVVAEVALTLVLLVGAALLVRSVAIIRRVDQDSSRRGLVSGGGGAWVYTAGRGGYWTPTGRELLDIVRAVPGVSEAALMRTDLIQGTFVLGDQGSGEPVRITIPNYQRVSADYVRVRGLRLLAGRDFSPGDVEGPGGVILDTGLARRLWPDGQAVGRFVKLGMGHWSNRWLPVVGVVERPFTLSTRDPGAPPRPVFLVAESADNRGFGVLVRTREPEAALSTRLTRAVRAAVTGPPGFSVGFGPWNSAYREFLRTRAFIGRVFLSFGLLALALAATGLYAVISQAVSRRLREFAIRMALGATNREIARLVARDAAVMVLAGTAVGAFAALWAGKFVDAWLYGVHYVDAPSLVLAEGVLLAAAVVACLVPLRRALGANPVDIVRAT